jgi:hypothetical protein
LSTACRVLDLCFNFRPCADPLSTNAGQKEARVWLVRLPVTGSQRASTRTKCSHGYSVGSTAGADPRGGGRRPPGHSVPPPPPPPPPPLPCCCEPSSVASQSKTQPPAAPAVRRRGCFGARARATAGISNAGAGARPMRDGGSWLAPTLPARASLRARLPPPPPTLPPATLAGESPSCPSVGVPLICPLVGGPPGAAAAAASAPSAGAAVSASH